MDLRTQREFLIDIEDLVEQLFTDTEELRREEGKSPQTRELLARIFRHVHSIKGIAATAGLAEVGRVAHQTETLLDHARSGRVSIEDRFVETLEEAANAISESLSATAAGSDAAPAAELIQSFHDLDTEDTAEVELPLPDLPSDLATAINDSERLLLLEALRENEKLYFVTADFDLAVFDKQFNELRSLITRHGAVISSLPSAGGAHPDRVVFRILCSSSLELPELQDHLATFPQAAITALTNTLASETVKKPSPFRSQADNASFPPVSFVRIEIDELDRLISSAHELFGQTVAALDLVSNTLATDSRVELQNLDAQIRESLVSLEERLIHLRMVSLERVMQRAIRAGRVAAKVSGKEVDFITVGGQIRIDKIVCDAVADPLLHLVRNAVDQGIESPAERAQAGKSPAGTVRIEACSAGGRVRFLVSDDGRGVDPQVVSQAAARLGIVEDGTLLSSEKSLRLIFRPGFSTAAQVSSMSGRGVGLDIVESAIERVGGAVRVRTQVGQGTEFEIRLPVSLGVMRALLLTSGGYRYCVDAGLIVDHCEVEGEVAARASLSWRKEMLPLVDLRKLLPQSAAESNKESRALVCEFASEGSDGAPGSGERHAIVVESIEGTQDVLVRGLGRHSRMWPGVVGATELWDGTVALVLDLPLLLSLRR